MLLDVNVGWSFQTTKLFIQHSSNISSNITEYVGYECWICLLRPLLIKVANETIKNEAKEQKGQFLSMLLNTLGALLGNLLTGKGAIRAGGISIRAGQDF